jgi:methylated-DNA-[protein]-cysteine S-methyltransferase
VRFCTVSSPVGELLLTASDRGLTGLWVAGEHPVPAGGDEDAAPFEPVIAELDRYFAGERPPFDVPLDLQGTHWQLTVWSELRRIPYGDRITYRELAGRAGRPAAIRAAGHANGRNPISIIVPCHRVVGSDGSLTGYGGGLPAKRWLLDHEEATR